MNELLDLGMLVLLQCVLGFDNLLYISLESKRAPADRQSYVRKLGIGLAIVLRIALLIALTYLIQFFQKPWFEFAEGGWIEGTFNLHAVIVLIGGVFILYTAIKEIWHMMQLEVDHAKEREPSSVFKVVTWIVLMNLVFSFDSILTAIALTDTTWVQATAIIIGGVLMIVLADTVSEFLRKNRMYEVLGLFILFIVGIMLLTEGGHLAHLKLFGNPIVAMSKTTFYFVIGTLVLIDIVQGRYQRKLLREREAQLARQAEGAEPAGPSQG